MASDEFPFRHVSNFDMTVNLGLPLNKFFETDILKQFLEVLVIAGYIRSERSLVVILL